MQTIQSSHTSKDQQPPYGDEVDSTALVVRLREHAALHADLSAHDDEQAQWARDVTRAAELLELMRQYINVLHGVGEPRHLYDRTCPDETQPDSRDAECPACKILTQIGA